MVWFPQRIFLRILRCLYRPDGGEAMPGQKMLESTPFRTRFRDDSGWAAGSHFGGGICVEYAQLIPANEMAQKRDNLRSLVCKRARNLVFYMVLLPKCIFLRKSGEINWVAFFMRKSRDETALDGFYTVIYDVYTLDLNFWPILLRKMNILNFFTVIYEG